MTTMRNIARSALLYTLLLLVGVLASMTISYQTVRYLTRQHSAARPSAVNHAALREGMELRRYCNRMVALANAYAEETRGSGPGLLSPGTWLESAFRKDTGTLLDDMGYSTLPDQDAFRALLGAVERLQVLGNHPADPTLRQAALRTVEDTFEIVQRRLETLDILGRIAEPAVRPNFPH